MQSFQQTEKESPVLHQYILSTAKTAAIAAVVSLVASVAGVITTVTKPRQDVSMLPQQEGFSEDQVQQIAQSAVYVSAFISLAIGVLAFYFLFRFSTLAQSGINKNVPEKLTAALQSLGRYFKVWGVIMFLIMAFFILSLLGGIFGSFFGR